MKLTISFAISGLFIPTKQLKPFNPLIGETFQGIFENNLSRVYIEHISHYPTVSRFLILGDEDTFKLNGYFDFSTKNESFGSKLYVYQKGPLTVEFPKYKSKIAYNMPVVKLTNCKKEVDRAAYWVDTMVFVDVENKLKAVIKFANNNKYIHGIEGYICEYNFPNNYKYDIDKEITIANKEKINKLKILSTIKGSWLDSIKFDDVEYWNINKDKPEWIRPMTHVLPSDGRFREDIIWLFNAFEAEGNNSEEERKLFESYSQTWKVMLEQIQRAEREIRKKNKGK
jgi:hypothetical protein